MATVEVRADAGSHAMAGSVHAMATAEVGVDADVHDAKCDQGRPGYLHGECRQCRQDTLMDSW